MSTRNSCRAALAAMFAALASATAACGGGDAPADFAVTPEVRQQPQPAAEPTGERCTAGAFRDCTLHYTDERGQLHCPPATQFCGADGTWLPCGERDVDDAGAASD